MRNCSLMSLTSLKLMPEEFNQALGCKMQSDSKKTKKNKLGKKNCTTLMQEKDKTRRLNSRQRA